MPEHVYIWIVAIFCGFVGGALALSLTKLAVDDMWKQASQIASGYAWKYSTGGIGTATWGDVWRHNGGGPDELAQTMPWCIAGISLVAMFVGCCFPPPHLATGYPVPFISWMNLGLVVGLFVISLVAGSWLGSAESEEGCMSALASSVPGVVLLIVFVVSYFVSLSSAWLLIPLGIAVVVAWAALAFLACMSYDRVFPIAAIVMSVLVYVPMFALLMRPPFSPLHQLLAVAEEADGMPSETGIPPLKLREFVAPVTLVHAGWFEPAGAFSPSARPPVYVHLRDSRGTEALLCVEEVKQPDSSGNDKGNYALYVGGPSPKHPSARRPRSIEEARMLMQAFAGALRATPGIRISQSALSERRGQLSQAIEARKDEDKIVMRLASEAYSWLPPAEQLPLCNHSDLAAALDPRNSKSLEDAAQEFRSAKDSQRMSTWRKLEPMLAEHLRRHPEERTAEKLAAILGSKSVDFPFSEPQSQEFGWELPKPTDLDLLGFPLGLQKDRAHYALVDLRPTTRFSLRTVEVTKPTSSPEGSYANYVDKSTLAELAARFRAAAPEQRGDAWSRMASKLRPWMEQNDAAYVWPKLLDLLGEPTADLSPEVLCRGLPEVDPRESRVFGLGEVNGHRTFLVLHRLESGRPNLRDCHFSKSDLEYLRRESEPSLPSLNRQRLWVSADGAFSREAIFFELAGTEVILRKPDGMLIRVQLAKLSAADQQWIAEHVRSMGSDPAISPAR